MRRIAIVGTILCVGALLAHADTEEETRKRLEREFRTVPAPELPARAVMIVRNTPAAERSRAAIIAVETVEKLRPGAAEAVAAAISKSAPETRASLAAADHKEGHDPGQGNGNGNGNANGGVGLGLNKPGRPIVHDRPINTILPNGKPRNFPHDDDDPKKEKKPKKPKKPKKYNHPHSDD